MNTRKLTLEQAKALYPNRFTMEHIPKWAKDSMGNGRYYAPQYRTDLEWYENTVFPGEGDLSIRSRHCQSENCTWPLGTSLAAPYALIKSCAEASK